MSEKYEALGRVRISDPDACVNSDDRDIALLTMVGFLSSCASVSFSQKDSSEGSNYNSRSAPTLKHQTLRGSHFDGIRTLH